MRQPHGGDARRAPIPVQPGDWSFESVFVRVRSAPCIHAVLRFALNHTVDDNVIPTNVAAQADIPSALRAEGAPLSVAEAGCFLAAMAGHRLGAVYRVAIAVGLRRGEVCGLR